MPDTDFSFDRDVAPYANRVFGAERQSPFLKKGSAAALDERLVTAVEAARKRESEYEKEALARELTRVRIDTERAALEDARWKMGEERRAASAAPAVSSAFDSILSDSTLDQKQKKAAIHKWASNNADTIFRSPVLANKYRSAVQAVEPDERESLTPYQQITLLGRRASEERSEERFQIEQQQRAEKEEYDRRRDMLRDYDDTLKGIEILDKDPDTGLTTDPQTGRKIEPFFKNPIDRERLLDLIAPTARSQRELDELEKLSPVDLYRRASATRRRIAVGDKQSQDPQKTTIRALFGQ